MVLEAWLKQKERWTCRLDDGTEINAAQRESHLNVMGSTCKNVGLPGLLDRTHVLVGRNGATPRIGL